MIQIGPYQLNGRAVLAPMAGITDFPFRQMCRQTGAAMVTAEMSASNPALRNTRKSLLRLTNPDDAEPRAVQIVGTEAAQMAEAARYQVSHGAQIVDINMGCPAKKVCKKLAGSALLKDEKLVSEILNAVVGSVDVPVTLKIRTGWDTDSKNAVQIARIAQDCGIQSLAVHGRTRACRYHGSVEYDTIGAVVQAVDIPVFANGDITSAIKAKTVLDYTGADGVMIGRGAQGNPWIFREINDLLNNPNASSELFTAKSLNLGITSGKERLIMEHLRHIHRYYGDFEESSFKQTPSNTSTSGLNDDLDLSGNTGNKKQNAGIHTELAVRIARKHICWYFEQTLQQILNQQQQNQNTEYTKNTEKENIADSRVLDQEVKRLIGNIETAKKRFNQLSSCNAQLEHVAHFFGELQTTGDIAA